MGVRMTVRGQQPKVTTMRNQNNQLYQGEFSLGDYSVRVEGYSGRAHVVEVPSDGICGTGIGIIGEGDFRRYFPAREIAFRGDEVTQTTLPEPVRVDLRTLTMDEPALAATLATGIEAALETLGEPRA